MSAAVHSNSNGNTSTKRNLKEIEEESSSKKAKSHSSSSSSSSSSSASSSSPFSIDVQSLHYLNGFGGHLQSEALPDTLPQKQNSPQKVAHGLYAEQLSGSSFTTPRDHNQRSWLYRIRPTAAHKPFKPVTLPKNEIASSSSSSSSPSPVSGRIVSDFSSGVLTPNQLRWKPLPLCSDNQSVDFIQGIQSICGSGNPEQKSGLGIHVYTCNTSMQDKAIVNSDGDFLIVPQEGALLIRTEFGYLHVPPKYICVIQRGMTFSVEVNQSSRGYICEIYNSHFRLPELGPIGANGLANPRDFESPVASFEDKLCSFTIVQKFMGTFWTTQRDSSPFDVVGYHGNYVPYRYDLTAFCPAGAVLFDHMDPSIFTVLTAPSVEPGVAACDFVIFPERWAVQEHTFRPPYYHRNVMSEYMGNICGEYEAKPDGFLPGGGSLHSIMVGHGPDADAFKKNSDFELKPQRLSGDSLAFMFESTFAYRVCQWALDDKICDADYYKCWEKLPRLFQQGKFVNENNNHNNVNSNGTEKHDDEHKSNIQQE